MEQVKGPDGAKASCAIRWRFPRLPPAHGRQQALCRGPGIPEAARLSGRAGRELAGKGHREDGRASRQVPLVPGLPRLLRQMRRLHRQVPLFPRHRRPEEHAGRAPGSAAQGLPPLFHPGRQIRALAGRRRGPHRTRCWTTGTAISTSARSAAAAPSTARSASTPPKSPWPLARSWTSIGKGQKYSNEIIGKVHKIGNNLGLPPKALKSTLEGLEEEMRRRPAFP